MVIYYITRTFLNGLRSIEALVMAIVFVIAVGIGPFAGVMALGLHTIVSLAKLYSEQVESIMAGPLEAIQATGANRLQTIIYAVIPQIIPPYISYTMYRWDINVRMSTIIGFVGGGGIGFLLQQNINLLNYRAASAQMFAIAIVVASMDYISSVLREKYVLASRIKKPVSRRVFLCSRELVGQGVADGAEGVPDLGSQQAHNSNHDDRHESKDDRVFHQALAFFLGCE
jgi:phosphonate transport system permease protein